MRKTYKYRCFPTLQQKQTMNNILDQCRYVYNKTLEFRKKEWEENKKPHTKYSTHRELTKWKKEKEELKAAYSQSLQEVQERVDYAYRGFFRRLKTGDKPGYPRFKSRFRYHSFSYPQIGSTFKFEDNKVRLPRLGWLRIKRHRNIQGTIKRITLKKSWTNKWYILFSVEYKPEKLPANNKAIGIDLGIRKFLTDSQGNEIPNPKFLSKEEKELKKAHRKLSAAEKGSKERNRRRKILARIHERLTNKRNNFAHQLSRRIINNCGIIAAEKLQILNMNSSIANINKSINDVAWNKFINCLVYKAEEAGRLFQFVNPRNTSKTCSRCGNIKKEFPLRKETYSCEKCDLYMDRDHNAAINILRLGLQSLGDRALEAPSL